MTIGVEYEVLSSASNASEVENRASDVPPMASRQPYLEVDNANCNKVVITTSVVTTYRRNREVI